MHMFDSRGEPRAERVGVERQVADEISVRTTASVLGLPPRLVEIAIGERRVEVVEQRAVVEHRAPAAPLCVSGHLAAIEREIRRSRDVKARKTQRLDDRFENHGKPSMDVEELRP
jgi:hypothetical protein